MYLFVFSAIPSLDGGSLSGLGWGLSTIDGLLVKTFHWVELLDVL